jgi:hypothetical protein
MHDAQTPADQAAEFTPSRLVLSGAKATITIDADEGVIRFQPADQRHFYSLAIGADADGGGLACYVDPNHGIPGCDFALTCRPDGTTIQFRRPDGTLGHLKITELAALLKSFAA